MGNLQRTSYRFSFVDVTLRVNALFNVIHSAMGDRKVPRTEAGTAFHMLGALRWLYNYTQKLFCVTLFLVCVSFLLFSSPGSSLSASHFSMAIFEMTENWSRLARKWRIRAGTEPNATIGQLVKTRTPIGCGTTNISDTQKDTCATGCWRIWCP